MVRGLIRYGTRYSATSQLSIIILLYYCAAFIQCITPGVLHFHFYVSFIHSVGTKVLRYAGRRLIGSCMRNLLQSEPVNVIDLFEGHKNINANALS